MNLADYAGIRMYSDERVGLEIEVEAETQLPISVANWASALDNSLRGHCLEYKSRTPFLLNNVNERTRVLFNAIKDSRPSFSSRTSVHVHVNVSDMEVKKVFVGLFYSLLIESALINKCAKHRRANKFCTRFNYNYVEKLKQAFNSGTIFVSNEAMKYTAIACHTLGQFGTIEFRSKEGTCDPTEVSEWASLCNDSVRRSAERWDSPESMLEELIDNDNFDILSVLPAKHKLDLDKETYYDTLLLLSDLVFQTDWSQWDSVKKKSKSIGLNNVYDAIEAPPRLNRI